MDQDSRFDHIINDPKFRRIPKTERKIKIDQRFQSMFNDTNFKLKFSFDKRGRPVNLTSTEDLKRYYDISSADESSDNEQEETNDLNKKCDTNGNVSNNIKKKLKNLDVDYARGEAALISDSSSDDEINGDNALETESVEHGWGELDKDAEQTDLLTNRLAVCNQDWDRIRAVDLMVLFTSFISSGSVIHSITIYPSNFGLQRMKEEEVKGPIELVEVDKTVTIDFLETEEGLKYHEEKLRQYQLNRLKYYYAIVVCDSTETASRIYAECDGLEYESSATKIDLRFVSDDTNFENKPKEICDKIPEKYESRFFTTTALQQVKVELTWDETCPERLEVAKKISAGNLDDIKDTDLQIYLASSSDDENEVEDTDIIKNELQESSSSNSLGTYCDLVKIIKNTAEKDTSNGMGMEITWGVNLKEKTEQLVKKKLDKLKEKTPFQQYLDKKKEKKKARRKNYKNKLQENADSDVSIPSDVDMTDPYFAEEFNKPEFKVNYREKNDSNMETEESKQENAELELLLMNENDSEKHFSLKKIQIQKNNFKKSRNKKKQASKQNQLTEDNFEFNVKDHRFSALFSSHLYNLDPTNSHYKKTKGMEKVIAEKMKRRNNSFK